MHGQRLFGEDGNVHIVGRVRPPAKTSNNINIDVKLVLVPVTVTDPLSVPVRGLRREAFQIFENGVEQPIKHFAVNDAPISLGIVFDASASMEGKLDKSRAAVAELFKQSMEGDEYFVVQFNDAPRLLCAFTPDTEAVQTALMYIRAQGWTSLLDAVYMSVQNMKRARNTHKALLVISDGVDNNSRFTEREIRDLLREYDVSIYAVGILGSGVTRRSMKVLSGLAEETGGRMFAVSGVRELPEAMEKVGAALRDQYLLGFTPVNGERDGKYRQIAVKVSPPAGSPPLHASWRAGYYAPY